MAVLPPPSGNPQPTQKTSDIITTLRPTKLFKIPKASSSSVLPPTTPPHITSLSFDDSGEYLLTSSTAESLDLYSTHTGKHLKTLLSQKYGAHLARFTHHSQSILYASTKGDPIIRYLSTHDNQYLRYFKAHTAPVTTIALSPSSDSFLSCSTDNTVRLWSLSSPTPQGRLNLTTPTLAAYDPSATVIAIASPPTSSILLYDSRNYDKAPFATFDLGHLDSTTTASPQTRSWTSLSFSNDGKSLLLTTTTPHPSHLLLDAFSGVVKAFLARPPKHLPLDPSLQRAVPGSPPTINNNNNIPGQGDACFSADGRYIVGASGGDRDAVVWDSQASTDAEKNLAPMATLPWKSKLGVVEWNPRFNMLASADKEVVFWLPDEHVAR
ncbi:member of Set1p complex, histone methyl transferase [Loxospora ochrophaea]|nr:member of Set1p complex, histone methyl transferase [Loxospora ochrophaea]